MLLIQKCGNFTVLSEIQCNGLKLLFILVQQPFLAILPGRTAQLSYYLFQNLRTKAVWLWNFLIIGRLTIWPKLGISFQVLLSGL